MSIKKHHADWLSLLEVSGPFVSLPVLEKVFPQGLEKHDADHARRMRLAFEEWETNQTGPRADPAIHNAWVNFVLKETLALADEVLATGQAVPQTLRAVHGETGEVVRPEIVVRNPSDVPNPGQVRLMVLVFPADQKLDKHVPGCRWKASPIDRMAELLQQTKCSLGLVTNGDHWVLANKTGELPSGFASWYAWLWLDHSSDTFAYLRAFRSLLGAGRFFGALPGQTLEEMLAESATHQQEVTDQLGYQVRKAVEVLIQSLDRADQDYGRKLLEEIPETVLYEAALTVMMRLVFLFCAEERELLLLGDPLYDQHYAVSTLVAQLQETADNHTEEILERRRDAWIRLLSTFRAVFGGVQHERMKLPPYAGNLFDPDRFPFLEGRQPKTTWKDTPASPLPVNNRTVLHLLRSLQYLQTHGEAQRVSFRALGIEQIGHVYEGLLDHTAKRAKTPMLGLLGGKGLEPEVSLSELETRQKKGEDDLVNFLKEETGRSESALRKGLARELENDLAGKLQAACGNDKALFDRVAPFAGLIASDSFGRPIVIREKSVFVTTGTDRRTSGTHYTPTSLTIPIVKHTLDPLCYVGPAEGKPESEWQLRSAKELLDLKICDMACGSGAFLVQACRYLSELLVQSWEQATAQGSSGEAGKALRITPYGEVATGAADEQLIPVETEERLVYARRLIAQRCLYGVDKNPLAVEMAKLSLWLLTLAKDKPFTFLDHSIRAGDSLVGISNIEQLLRFSLDERVKTGPLLEQQRKQIENRLNAVKLLRRHIEELPSNTPQDIERKALMLKNSNEQTRRLTYAADMLLAESWLPMSAADREAALNSTLVQVEYKFKDLPVELLNEEATKNRLRVGITDQFHWPLEFPEVFDRGGFDGFVCNPPFVGGRRIRSTFGVSYLRWLTESLFSKSSANADLCAFFFRRAASLIKANGCFGILATNTIAQGDTRQVGLEALQIHEGCNIIRAVSSRVWPGAANVFVAHVWIFKGAWSGEYFLDDTPVATLTATLTPAEALNENPHQLVANREKSYQGSIVLGMGFVLEPADAARLISSDKRNNAVVFPYIGGQELNTHPEQLAQRYVINFFDWPLDRTSAADIGHVGPVAADYPDCLSIIEREVKPERTRRKSSGEFVLRKPLPQKWWIYADKRPALYNAISEIKRVLIVAQVSRTLAFTFVPTGWVYSHKTVVFPFDRGDVFAVLQSAFHSAWAWKYTSTLKEDLRACFES